MLMTAPDCTMIQPCFNVYLRTETGAGTDDEDGDVTVIVIVTE